MIGELTASIATLPMHIANPTWGTMLQPLHFLPLFPAPPQPPGPAPLPPTLSCSSAATQTCTTAKLSSTSAPSMHMANPASSFLLHFLPHSPTLSHTSLPHLRRYLDPRHYQVIQHFRLLDIADYVHCMAYDAPGKHSTMAFAKQASSQGLRFAKSFSGIWNLILIGFLRRLGVLGCFV